jgi:hypothetical protein
MGCLHNKISHSRPGGSTMCKNARSQGSNKEEMFVSSTLLKPYKSLHAKPYVAPFVFFNTTLWGGAT